MLWLALLFTAAAHADCALTPAAAAVRAKVKIENLTGDLCTPSTPAHELFTALAFLRAHPLPKREGTTILPENAWAYFTKRVQTIHLEDQCPDGKMAFVKPEAPGLMHVCPWFTGAQTTLAERLPSLLHEAHHFDGDHFPHENCTQGYLTGLRGACDKSLAYGGGYAAEVEALGRLSLIPDFPAELRGRLRTRAVSELNENFNAAPFAYELRTVYLVDDKNHGYLLDPETRALRPAPYLNPATEHLVSRGQTLNAFPQDGRAAYQVDVFSAAFAPIPATGEISENFNALPAKERPEMIAVYNDGSFSGLVTRSHLSIAFGDNPYATEVNLPLPARATFTAAELGAGDPNALYVLVGERALLPVQFHAGRTFQFLPTEKFPLGFRAMALFQGERLALSAEGELLHFAQGAWSPLPAAKGKHFTYMSKPFYWAKLLAE